MALRASGVLWALVSPMSETRCSTKKQIVRQVLICRLAEVDLEQGLHDRNARQLIVTRPCRHEKSAPLLGM